MKNRLMQPFFALFLAILMLSGVKVSAESYSASSMRLLRYEGEVEILNPDGESRFVMENARFDSGEAMLTGKESLASVDLDKAKIVTLDEKTKVDFEKDKNSLTMKLSEGALLLDVQEKLDENETLDIETSTMVVGIRGTIVFVSSHPYEDPTLSNLEEVLNERVSSGEMITTLGVLEGTAQVTYKDENGTERTIPVSAGQKATLRGDGIAPAGEPAVEEMTAADLSSFVVNELNNNPTLYHRVEDATGLASEASGFYPRDGKWIINNPVLLVAQSASKMYDGTPLTRPSDVLVYGLPNSFSIKVSAAGSQTLAGSSANKISAYTIYNAEKEDVTNHFAKIETVDGTLTVDPTPLYIWTDSAEKVYDGTPLTAPGAGVSTVPGHQRDKVVWRNMSYILSDTDNVQVLYGICGEVKVHGTNPLTGETQEISLPAGKKLLVYLHDEEGKQSIEMVEENLPAADLPAEILHLLSDNPDLMAQACNDAGWNEQELAALIEAQSMQAENNQAQATKYDLLVDADKTGRLMKDFTNVSINIDTEITDYNNRALGEEEAHYTPVEIDESITVKATGSQTEVGSSPNTYTIDWGSSDPSNYIVSEELGTLTVVAEASKKPEKEPEDDDVHTERVVLTAGSASKVFDGTPLTNSDVSAAGLPAGFTFAATARGSQTDAGTGENVIESFRILDGAGKDVTALFPNVTIASGTLTVEPLSLGINLGGTTAEYNGSPYVPDASIVYQNGPHAGESVTGARLRDAGTKAVSVLSRFSLFTGDSVNLEISGMGSDAGTYTLTGKVIVSSGKADNYSCSFSGQTLTIGRHEATITTGSAQKPYDGTPLTSSEAEITGLTDVDSVTVTATGTITDVGSTVNTYAIDWGEVNSGNYTVTENLGTLEITPNDTAIVITAGSDRRTYDGTALTCDDYSVSTVPEGIEIVARTSGSQTDVGNSDNVIESFTVLDSEGNDVTAYFTNITTEKGTLTVDPAAAEITTGSAAKPYDGTVLTAAEAGISGLAGNDSAVVTATGAIAEVGTADNTYSIDWGSTNPDNYTITENLGTLEVTKNGTKITITAGSFNREYWASADPTWNKYEVEGLPGSLHVDATVKGEQFVAGTSDNVITDYHIYNAANEDRTENFTNVELVNGTLTVTKAPVSTWTTGVTKTYDGKPISGYHTNWTGIYWADSPESGVSFVFTGGTSWIKDVGSVELPFTATLRSDLRDKYEITEMRFGENKITPAQLTVTTESASRAYNGTPLTAGAHIEGLAEGESVTVNTKGTITTPGSVSNTYEIDWASSIANQNNYEIASEELGTLTVTKAPLTVITESDVKVFDGSPLTAGASIEGLQNGETAPITATGTITEPGSVINTYEIDWDAGTADQNNYEITSEKLGRLSVTHEGDPVPLTVITDSSSKTYDGKPLVNTGARLVGLSKSSDATVSTIGTITDAGSVINDYEIEWGTTNPDDYVITEELGTLTVTKAPLTVTTGSSTKTYNGTALTSSEAEIKGLQNSETAEIKTKGSITNAGSVTNGYTIDWTSADKDNYTITEELGKLTVSPAELIIETGDAWKYYDGTPLTSSDVYIEGLQNGETITVTTTGSITEVGYEWNTYEISWGTANSNNYSISNYLGILRVLDPSEEPIDVPMIGEAPEEEPDPESIEEEAADPEDQGEGQESEDSGEEAEEPQTSEDEEETGSPEEAQGEDSQPAGDAEETDGTQEEDQAEDPQQQNGADTTETTEPDHKPQPQDNAGGDTGAAEAAASENEPQKPDSAETPAKPEGGRQAGGIEAPAKQEEPQQAVSTETPAKTEEPQKPVSTETPSKPEKPQQAASTETPAKQEEPQQPVSASAPAKQEAAPQPESSQNAEVPPAAAPAVSNETSPNADAQGSDTAVNAAGAAPSVVPEPAADAG